MIKINLLPVRAAKKREFGRQQLILFALLVVGAVLGNFFWYQRVQGDLDSVEGQIARTRQEIAQLDKTIGEVKSITQEKKALEDKLKILDSLKKGRTGPVKVLDELATIIPAKVWLASYVEAGSGVTLHGSAVAYEDLSTFSKRLKASQHFRDIVIKRAQQRSDGIVEWDIICSAD